MQVTDHLTQCSLPPVGFGVLLTGEPAQEIGWAVVEFVGDEMVANADVGFAVLAGVRGAFAVESERHEDVAVGMRQPTSHTRITTTLFVRPLSTLGISVRNLLSLRIEEIAVGVRPTDDVFGVLDRTLFAAS